MSSQFTLLKQRRFGPFFVTQFLGAFNDNLYKNAMVILLAFHGAAITSMSSDIVIQLSGGLFILPFFLFSATAGQIADKMDKARLARMVKAFEIGAMALGALGFYYQNLFLLMGALGLMGLHSTVFGPVKYAILPQHLERDELIGGNGLVEMGTNVAILLGTMLGGILIGRDHGAMLVAATSIAVAIIGYLSSRAIPAAPPAPAAKAMRINWNPFTETWRNLQFCRRERRVWLSIIGISWFWLYGLVFLSQFPNLTRTVLQGDESVVSLLLTVFSLGVGIGSLLCERLSGHKVEIGLVPFGALGLTIFGADFYFATTQLSTPGLQDAWMFLADTQHVRLLADLCLIGLFGGFYIVPLYALIQVLSAPEHRSRIIAGNNIVNAAAMVLSVGMVIGMLQVGLSIGQVLLATALLNAVVAIYIFALAPEFLMRFLIWLWVRTAYRLKKEGLEAVPAQGAALLVGKHVNKHINYVDALVIAAACPRPVRFVIEQSGVQSVLLNFIFRTGGAIRFSSASQDRQSLEQAGEAIAAALAAGDLLCFLPDGGVTADGNLAHFKAAVQLIVQRMEVPVVPLSLQDSGGGASARTSGSLWQWLRYRCCGFTLLRAGAPLAASELTSRAFEAHPVSLHGAES